MLPHFSPREKDYDQRLRRCGRHLLGGRGWWCLICEMARIVVQRGATHATLRVMERVLKLPNKATTPSQPPTHNHRAPGSFFQDAPKIGNQWRTDPYIIAVTKRLVDESHFEEVQKSNAFEKPLTLKSHKSRRSCLSFARLRRTSTASVNAWREM